MYQNGDVDFLVATDAIGMGLNLDVEHVAFAGRPQVRRHQYRRLNPAEFGQIAGRAGRHMRDGTFGTTGRCAAVRAGAGRRRSRATTSSRCKILQWRNSDLDFSIDRRAASPRWTTPPTEPGLTRAPIADGHRWRSRSPRATRRCAAWRRRRRRSSDCGKSARCPTIARSRPPEHADLVATLYRLLCGTDGPRPTGCAPGRVGATAPMATSTRSRPHRAGANLDLRRQPAGLACRS